MTAPAPYDRKEVTMKTQGQQQRSQLKHEQEIVMENHKENSSANYALLTIGVLLLGMFMFTLLSGSAHATDISFGYSFSCDGYNQHCPTSNLLIPIGVGSTASDNVAIASVNGLTIGAGNLSFTSPGATSSFDDPPGVIDKFDNPGGSFIITGVVPGLWTPTTLLGGTFLAGGRGDYHTWGEIFQSPIDVTFVNPTLLDDLGMSGSTPYGYGTLVDAVYFNGPGQDWSVQVTYAPSPEPGSLMLLGSGVVGIGGLLRKRLGRDV